MDGKVVKIVSGGNTVAVNTGAGTAAGTGVENNGVGLKANCQKGLIAETDRGLEHGISGVVNNAEGIVNDVTVSGHLLGPVGGTVNHVGKAAQGLLDNVDHGLGNGIDDIACGLGKIADEAAVAIDTGDLTKGVKDIARTAATSVGDAVKNVVGGAVHGVDSVLSQAADIIEDL